MTETMNLKDMLSEAEKEWGVGGVKDQWYKLSEGSNKIRVLSILTPYASHFKVGACVGKETCPECKKMIKSKDKNGNEIEKSNNPGIKFLCHVFDYTDNQIKLAQFPYLIAKALQTLQDDPDWAFSEAPMPYDIKINATGAGTKEVEYNLVAVPQEKSTPITAETLTKLAKLHTTQQVKEAMQNKRKKELGMEVEGKTVQGSAVPYPTNDNDDGSGIPF